MTKKYLELDNKLTEIEILAKRVKVMIDDVQQGYFGSDIKSMDDAWRIMPPYYNAAGIKVDIAYDIVFNLINQLIDLRTLLDDDNKKDGVSNG